MSDPLPHVDGSGRGLDDGDCIHCGMSGSIEHGECPTRLRQRVDALEQALIRLSEQAEQTARECPTRDPVWRQLGYSVREAAWHYGVGEEP